MPSAQKISLYHYSIILLYFFLVPNPEFIAFQLFSTSLLLSQIAKLSLTNKCPGKPIRENKILKAIYKEMLSPKTSCDTLKSMLELPQPPSPQKHQL